MGNPAIQSLIAELDSITESAAKLQNDATTDADAATTADSYYDWYGRALSLLPNELHPRFRDAFEGGTFTMKIEAFLANPKAPNPLYDASRPNNPIASSPFQHDFQKHFRTNASTQRQILIEASHQSPAASPAARVDPDGDVFIVHGHAEDHLHATARLVSKLTQREPVILREQPNGGRTIIEKFESHASQCAFALVLLTADDLGRSAKVQDEQPRARQNVVFEAGYFVGLLGRGKVVLLHEHGVELPSDLDGVLYVELSGGWQTNVGIEMRAAGLDIDLNRLSSGD